MTTTTKHSCRIAAIALCAGLTIPPTPLPFATPPAAAQELPAQELSARELSTQEPSDAGADSDSADSADSANSADSADSAASSEAPTPERTAAPDTDRCPNLTAPPPATTTSERRAPGSPEPTPLAVDPRVAEQTADGCGLATAPGFEMPKDIMASAFLVTDLDSGAIVATKDPHGRYRPASIIKVLLALVAIDELDLKKPVTISAESANQEGSRVGIGEGGVYTVDDLLHGLILASGNDAAHALAQELGGDEATLKKVNALAEKLGTTETHVATYSGLDAPGMSTSAYDLGLMYQAAFANPTFADIANTESYKFPGYEGHEGFEVWNDNGLFMNDPDGIGGKTGYTDDAHHTFVGATDKDGRRLMAVILDTTIDGGRAWEQAQRLIDAARKAPKDASLGELTPVSKDTEQEVADTESTESTDSTAARDGKRTESGGEEDVAKEAGSKKHRIVGIAIAAVIAGLSLTLISVAFARASQPKSRHRQPRRRRK